MPNPPSEVPRNEVHPEGKLLPFPTVKLMAEFTTARDLNMISWFRKRNCNSCRKEVPKQYECCSENCHLKLHPKEKPRDE